MVDQRTDLSAPDIVSTLELLERRISERFPDRGLASICGRLLEVARHAQERAEQIARPIIGLRICILALIALIIASLIGTVMTLQAPAGAFDILQFVQLLESGINDVIFVGAAIFFLTSLESRIKRNQTLRVLHQLRSLAHIVDMHQLTKDPQRLLPYGVDTKSSPATMTRFELSRYLDYCSEMLSLTGKIAALFVANFDDSVALASVNELENLSTGLSRKVWQKLMLLHMLDQPNSGGDAVKWAG